MKNTLGLILMLCIFMCSCSSNQDKAEDLISDYMFKNLNDFGSYEAIETKVDSFYTSIYTDSFIVKRATNVIEFSKELLELEALSKKLHESIMRDINMTRFDKAAFDRLDKAHKQQDETWDLRRKHIDVVNNEKEIIKVNAGKFESKFNGWQATHRFRCKSAGGTYSIHNYMFYFDNDIKTIISCVDLDDEKYLEIIKAIDEAIKAEEKRGGAIAPFIIL